MKHGSLFSGIGGFDLAAEWMGWDNEFHCEWAEFPRKILHHYWPNAISYNDVTQTDFTAHADQIDILTGGFPCQPYSAAGKRKGKDDDRHLWPHMLRAIREIRPRWVVGENVFGLTTWNGGVVLEEVCAELEAEGYAVQPFIIPACAVGAPHRRDRVWIVAYSVSTGTRHQEHPSCNQEWGTCGNREKSLRQTHGTPSASGANATSANDAFASETDLHGRNECNGNDEVNAGQGWQHAQRDTQQSDEHGIIANATGTNDRGTFGNVRGAYEETQKSCITKPAHPNVEGIASNTGSERLQGSIQAGINAKQNRHIRSIKAISQHLSSDGSRIQFQDFPTVAPICGGDDGLPRELDGITFPKWRTESIKGYGNAIVPQVAFQIFKAIEHYEHTNSD
jgi:DNA (cytosine-5)-methyltransferase 1